METTRLSATDFTQRGVAEWRDYRCVLHEGTAGVLLEVQHEGRVVAEVQLSQRDSDPMPTLMLYKKWPAEGEDELDRVTVSL